jgi:hypothetical protein
MQTKTTTTTPAPKPDAQPVQAANLKPVVFTVTAKRDWLKAEQQNTINGEHNGQLDSALAAESVEDLAGAFYALRCSPHFSNHLFGGNHSRWENKVRAELSRRGIGGVKMDGPWPHTITV